VLVHPRSPLPTPPLFQTETAPSKVQIRKKGGWISSSAAGAHRSIDRSIPFLPAAARRPTDSVSEPNPLPPLSQIEQAAADGERVSRSTVPDSTPSKASPAAPIPRFDAESGVFRGSRDALAPGLPRRSSRGRATHVVGAVQQLQPPPGVHPVVGAEVPRAEARALHRGGPR